jgi:hypothetical protein
LLIKNPSKRLGNKRGIEEIKNHPWCKDIDWNKFLKKEISPPFLPSIRTSNFDPEYTTLTIDFNSSVLGTASDSDTDEENPQKLSSKKNKLDKKKNSPKKNTANVTKSELMQQCHIVQNAKNTAMQMTISDLNLSKNKGENKENQKSKSNNRERNPESISDLSEIQRTVSQSFIEVDMSEGENEHPNSTSVILKDFSFYCDLEDYKKKTQEIAHRQQLSTQYTDATKRSDFSSQALSQRISQPLTPTTIQIQLISNEDAKKCSKVQEENKKLQKIHEQNEELKLIEKELEKEIEQAKLRSSSQTKGLSLDYNESFLSVAQECIENESGVKKMIFKKTTPQLKSIDLFGTASVPVSSRNPLFKANSPQRFSKLQEINPFEIAGSPTSPKTEIMSPLSPNLIKVQSLQIPQSNGERINDGKKLETDKFLEEADFIHVHPRETVSQASKKLFAKALKSPSFMDKSLRVPNKTQIKRNSQQQPPNLDSLEINFESALKKVRSPSASKETNKEKSRIHSTNICQTSREKNLSISDKTPMPKKKNSNPVCLSKIDRHQKEKMLKCKTHLELFKQASAKKLKSGTKLQSAKETKIKHLQKTKEKLKAPKIILPQTKLKSKDERLTQKFSIDQTHSKAQKPQLSSQTHRKSEVPLRKPFSSKELLPSKPNQSKFQRLLSATLDSTDPLFSGKKSEQETLPLSHRPTHDSSPFYTQNPPLVNTTHIKPLSTPQPTSHPQYTPHHPHSTFNTNTNTNKHNPHKALNKPGKKNKVTPLLKLKQLTDEYKHSLRISLSPEIKNSPMLLPSEPARPLTTKHKFNTLFYNIFHKDNKITHRTTTTLASPQTNHPLSCRKKNNIAISKFTFQSLHHEYNSSGSDGSRKPSQQETSSNSKDLNEQNENNSNINNNTCANKGKEKTHTHINKHNSTSGFKNTKPMQSNTPQTKTLKKSFQFSSFWKKDNK